MMLHPGPSAWLSPVLLLLSALRAELGRIERIELKTAAVAFFLDDRLGGAAFCAEVVVVGCPALKAFPTGILIGNLLFFAPLDKVGTAGEGEHEIGTIGKCVLADGLDLTGYGDVGEA